MKFTIALLSFILGASASMACMPSGERLKSNQKADLVRILKSSPAASSCVAKIEKDVVKDKENWKDASIYETLRVGGTTYVVKGINRQLVINQSLVAMGKVKYTCGKSTFIPKCM